MGPKCYTLQWGRKPPILPFHLGFRHRAGGAPSHGDRQRAQKFGKHRAHVVREISSRSDGQTDRHRRAHYNISSPLPRENNKNCLPIGG